MFEKSATFVALFFTLPYPCPQLVTLSILLKMDYEWFKAEIYTLTGIDLNLYKEKQMKRRIENYISMHRLGDYKEFRNLLVRDAGKLAQFLDYITINVTEFFRTPEHWQQLEELVLPRMQSYNVWSCACSTGEEAYSIAMSLAEHISTENIHVLATDVDERVLAIARKGIYSENAIETVPEKYRTKYFERTHDGYKVCKEILQCVEFRKLNLLADEFPKDQDLILCRNILIYFVNEAKVEIYASFLKSLKPGGFLFTGHTEQMIHYKEMGYCRLAKSIYYRYYR